MAQVKFERERKAAALSLAALALSLAAGRAIPVRAQDSGSPAPTPAPVRTPDFRLPAASEGRAPGVQGPADNGLPPLAPGERRGIPTPAPQPAPPRVIPTQPAPTTTQPAPTPAPTPAPGPTRRNSPAPASATPRAASAPSTTAPVTVAPQPTGDDQPTGNMAATDAVPAPDADGVPAAPAKKRGPPIWAWLLAALVAVGAGLWYWRRRAAFAGPHAAEEPEAPAAQPPAPRAAQPRPVPPTPRPPAPAPARTASPLVTRPAAERRAMVAMALEIHAIRILPDHVAVAFALNLNNQGPLAATGLMVRIALNQGSAMPEAVLARFFDGAGGSVLRDDMTLAPGAGERLSTEVSLPRSIVEPLMIGGKPMLVPVLAFDVTYHWDGPGEAFGQNAGSFVIGREHGASGSEKLAPLPLDRPTYVVDRAGSRVTTVARNQ